MKTISLFFLLLALTACSQNVGAGIGVAGVGSSGSGSAGTQIHADTDTGIQGSVFMDTSIRL